MDHPSAPADGRVEHCEDSPGAPEEGHFIVPERLR